MRLTSVTLNEFFELHRGTSIGFDDLVAFGSYETAIAGEQVSLETEVAPGFKLAFGILGSPMNDVTDAAMAIHLAKLGAIGVIHFGFLNQDDQIRAVEMVKRAQGKVIWEPATLAPGASVGRLKELRKRYTNIPVTEDGTPRGKFLGCIDRHCVIQPTHELVSQCVKGPCPTVGIEELRAKNGSADEEVDIDKAWGILQERSADALYLIDARSGELRGLITFKDLAGWFVDTASRAYRDRSHRLRVGAAIPRFPDAYRSDKGVKSHLEKLVEAGVDLIVIDTSHGHDATVREALRYVRQAYPVLPVIAGNVADGVAAAKLAEWGAHAIRVGTGVGAACTTEDVTGTGGRGQLSAIYECSRAVQGSETRTIADGGISTGKHVHHALLSGASAVMLGSLLAATDESPAREEGEFKIYRGMASASAFAERGDLRYQTGIVAPEGDVRRLKNAGSVYHMLPTLMAGVRQGFKNHGVRNIQELWKAAEDGIIRVERK